jgi:hypothetical protein
MKKYIKKPVEIEAVQWNGLNPTEIKDFAGDAAKGSQRTDQLRAD